MKKKLNVIISLLIGLIIFGFFLYKVGLDSVGSIFSNIKPFYLVIYLLITTIAFFPTAWRWQIILKAYKKKISFWAMLKYTIVGYAVSYVTPSVRLGGEPIRVYMLKKEKNIDLRTGSSSVIIDKFVELLGSAVFGLIGLILFLSLPQLSVLFKIIFGAVILIVFYLLFMLYYRTITGKGSFSSLFVSFRLDRITKWKKFTRTLEDVEKKMEKFFLKNKREFLWACFTYLVYGILTLFEFKFLLLSLGINLSFNFIILAVILWGAINFIPVPAALGFLEAGQSSLFSLIKGDGSIGFALSLLIRARALIFVAIGFSIISHFSGKQLEKVYRKNI